VEIPKSDGGVRPLGIPTVSDRIAQNGNNTRGFMMHSSLAVTPDGLPLGVHGMKTWVRPKAEFGKTHQRKSRSILEEESVKWLEGVEHLASLKTRCADTQFVGVGDRESDLFELFVAERPAGVDWLIRASWNRRARHPDGYLWEAVEATKPLGKTDLLVPARRNVPQRTARLTLRCATERLRPPKARARRLNEADVSAIHPIETSPPDGVQTSRMDASELRIDDHAGGST
jgi:hypothetical protein